MRPVSTRSFAAGLVLAAMLAPPASAQERTGDAALGAVSGAVVLGPIGAVAGAVVGWTAGPSISRSWGFRRSTPRHARPAKTAAQNTKSAPAQPAAPAAQPAPPAPKPNSAPSAKVSPPIQSAGTRTAIPPVQALE